ncbi:MAG: ABC transporter permease subunit [Bacillota bacterium]
MELKKEALRLFAAVLVAIVFLILMVFFPRTQEIMVYGPAGTLDFGYKLDINQYKADIVQYFQHVWKERTFGGTMFQTVSVEEEIARYYPKSLLIIGISFLLSISLGVWKGIFDYRNMNTKRNLLGNGTTWAFQSIPDFFVVFVFFCISIYFLPHERIFSNSNWYSFLAPAILVSIYPTMYVARLTCVSLLNQDGQDYIRTAFSKGYKSKQVIYKHILRNSSIDMVGNLPTIMIVIISNLLMVEYLTGFEGAANRLFVAMGGRQISGFTAPIEAELVLGLTFCFMITVLAVHILKLALLAKLVKKG